VRRRSLIIAFLGLAQASAAAQQSSQPLPQGADQPMTRAERIHWIVDGSIGPKSLAVVGPISVAWQTAWNVPDEWGQTWSGVGKRYVQRLADVSISNSLEGGLGAIWGERADYIRSGKKRFKSRLGYALKTSYLAYHPDGHLEFAWARLAGNTINNVIENAWLPPSATTWQQTTWRSASGFGSRAIGNVWEEFQPEIMRFVFRRK
jgi:hypothetical protein